MGVNGSVAFSDPPYPKSHSTSLFHSMTLHFSLSITHSPAPGPCHHTVPLFLNVLLVRSTLPPLAKSYSFLRSSPSPTASLQPSQDQSPMPPWSTVICVVELAVHSIIIPYMLVLLPQRRCKPLGGKDGPSFPCIPHSDDYNVTSMTSAHNNYTLSIQMSTLSYCILLNYT